MRGQRKHPLEVYRTFVAGRERGKDASGRRKARRPAAVPSDAPGGESASTEPFELRLNLNGSLVLLFTFVVLMGASYLYGYRSHRSAAASERSAQADELGRKLEESSALKAALPATSPPAAAAQPAPGAPDAPPATRTWYGVLLVTYDLDAGDAEALVKLLQATLSDTYGIKTLQVLYPKGRKLEMFAGSFASADDPELLRLLERARSISDYPHGPDKRPFRGALIKSFEVRAP